MFCTGKCWPDEFLTLSWWRRPYNVAHIIPDEGKNNHNLLFIFTLNRNLEKTSQNIKISAAKSKLSILKGLSRNFSHHLLLWKFLTMNKFAIGVMRWCYKIDAAWNQSRHHELNRSMHESLAEKNLVLSNFALIIAIFPSSRLVWELEISTLLNHISSIV